MYTEMLQQGTTCFLIIWLFIDLTRAHSLVPACVLYFLLIRSHTVRAQIHVRISLSERTKFLLSHQWMTHLSWLKKIPTKKGIKSETKCTSFREIYDVCCTLVFTFGFGWICFGLNCFFSQQFPQVIYQSNGYEKLRYKS